MSHYSSKDAWPSGAYESPVVAKQNPWAELTDNQMSEAPPNPVDLEINQYRHNDRMKTDEDASVANNDRGNDSGAYRMNYLRDEFNLPSDVQPGLTAATSVDPTADSGSDIMDEWSHLVSDLGKHSDAIEVRQAPNRELITFSVLIPAAALTPAGQPLTASVVELLSRDIRRQRVRIQNVGNELIYLGDNLGDVQAVPAQENAGPLTFLGTLNGVFTDTVKHNGTARYIPSYASALQVDVSNGGTTSVNMGVEYSVDGSTYYGSDQVIAVAAGTSIILNASNSRTLTGVVPGWYRVFGTYPGASASGTLNADLIARVPETPQLMAPAHALAPGAIWDHNYDGTIFAGNPNLYSSLVSVTVERDR